MLWYHIEKEIMIGGAASSIRPFSLDRSDVGAEGRETTSVRRSLGVCGSRESPATRLDGIRDSDNCKGLNEQMVIYCYRLLSAPTNEGK